MAPMAVFKFACALAITGFFLTLFSELMIAAISTDRTYGYADIKKQQQNSFKNLVWFGIIIMLISIPIFVCNYYFNQ